MIEKEAKPKRRADHRLKLNVIHCCDARAGLKKLPDACVDCVVTSPPFWSLRDYGVSPSRWADGTRSALGLEPSFDLYVEHLCEVFDEILRVLRPTGTLWVNLGDTYAGSWGNYAPNGIKRVQRKKTPAGERWPRPAYADTTVRPSSSLEQPVPAKSLCQIPSRFAIEMAQRGWILRNDIVWHKPNHMPSSVKDRFTCSWEHLFLFVKSARYYFDLDAVRIPHSSTPKALAKANRRVRQRPSPHLHGCRRCPNPGELQSAHPLGKNPGDYWLIPTQVDSVGSVSAHGATRLGSNEKHPSDVWSIITRPSAWGHFATYPEKLVERPIRAGCPARVCKRCGTPKLARRVFRNQGRVTATGVAQAVLGCKCKRGFQPGIVLDPFMGTGTTAVVAERLERHFIGFELNPQYVKTAEKRLAPATHRSPSTADTRPKTAA